MVPFGDCTAFAFQKQCNHHAKAVQSQAESTVIGMRLHRYCKGAFLLWLSVKHADGHIAL